MTIPTINYPTNLDNNDNLFLVHDSLRVTLVEDYNPGNTSITISGDNSLFPSTGIITLVEQCSDPEYRAIAFYYGSKTSSSFDNLELLPEFTDVIKPKNVTNVIMEVFNLHHNNLKDALISIEQFCGVKGTTDTQPFGKTLEGRINYLRNLVLPPKAWFTADTTLGVAPLKVCFTDSSLNNPTVWQWNLGDGTVSSTFTISGTSYISASVNVPNGISSVVEDDDAILCKTYYDPGKYDVTLTVTNNFGSDTITIPEYITVRAPAPDEATIEITPTKTVTNSLVDVVCTNNGEQSNDPIAEYTWDLSDDLQHPNAPQTIASYGVGGIYDAKLRVDTELGAYRITVVPNAINVVEQTNLWMLLFDSPQSTLSVTKNSSNFEFGIISETFKTTDTPTLAVTRDYTFANSYPNATYQQNLFLRNSSFTAQSNIASGNNGQAMIYWATNQNAIQFMQLQPFAGIWSTPPIGNAGVLSNSWNWTSFNSSFDVNVVFGENPVSGNPTNTSPVKQRISLVDYSTSATTYSNSDFENGADDLLTYPDSAPATYRSVFQGSSGYLARNDAGPGVFFRIVSFYTASGVMNNYIQNFLKVSDIPGSSRTELQLVALQAGIYVFNNSGEVALYSPTSNTWSASFGPGYGSAAFDALQDTSVSGFSNTSNTLLAVGDNNHQAYLSYDYSPNAFIKYNEVDSTFSALGSRPNSNEQWVLGIF